MAHRPRLGPRGVPGRHRRRRLRPPRRAPGGGAAVMWLDRALAEPCWLEEYLTLTGVADLDWTRRIPDEVITVVVAMHRHLIDQDYPQADALALIADHFTAAGEVHVAAQTRT